MKKTIKSKVKKTIKNKKTAKKTTLKSLAIKLPMVVAVSTDMDDHLLTEIIFTLTGKFVSITRCGDCTPEEPTPFGVIGAGEFYEHAIIHLDLEDSPVIQKLVQQFQPVKEDKQEEQPDVAECIAALRRNLHSIEKVFLANNAN
jgi:hypothetical protein